MESYPSGPITNYGIQLLQEGMEPLITYTSPDGDVAFYLNGGLAPWPGVTDGVVLAEGMSGLHPIFNHLDQRGARQDGATWADTVYDPTEMMVRVTLTARTPSEFKKLVRRWFAAWDPEKTGRLSWVTPDSGEWWCYPRLMRTPPEKLEAGYARTCKQTFTWSIRNDDAFWRSYDSIAQFGFTYGTSTDTFDRDDAGTLGANWQQTYTGPGSGVCETDPGFLSGRVVWTPSGDEQRTVRNRFLGVDAVQTVSVVGTPTTWKLTFDSEPTANISHPASAATVQTALENLPGVAPGDVSVSGSLGGPYTVTFLQAHGKQVVSEMVPAIVASSDDQAHVTVATTVIGSRATTTTDNQVVSVRLGDFFHFPFPDVAHIDIWMRLDTDDANPTGIRLRIGPLWIRVSRFNSGTETVLRQRPLLLTPIWGEKWSLVCSGRTFTVMRSGIPVAVIKEQGTGSVIGASNRGFGFGMEAGDGFFMQKVPPSIFDFSAGDNATATQSGYLTLTNFGDQPASPDLVVYGPGMFKFGNGPDVEPTITFGPLTDGQVALIKTKPGNRAVYDITADYSEQDLPIFQDFIQRLIGFAFNDNIPPLMSWFESLFGVPPPQGNMYALLGGRWTRQIPARPVMGSPTPANIAVEVVDGNSNSRVVAALTPRRRWPE